MTKINKGVIPQTNYMSSELFQFISKMLDPNPKQRLSVQEILQHKLIQDFLNDYSLKSVMPLKLRQESEKINTSIQKQHSLENMTENNKLPEEDKNVEDCTSFDIGQEDEGGSENRIAKLNKYNESSKQIHYKPKSK